MNNVTRNIQFGSKYKYKYFYDSTNSTLGHFLLGNVTVSPENDESVNITGSVYDVVNVELFVNSDLTKPKKFALLEELESIYGFVGKGSREVFCEVVELTEKAYRKGWMDEIIKEGNLQVITHRISSRKHIVVGTWDVCILAIMLAARQKPEDLLSLGERLTSKYGVQFQGINALIEAVTPPPPTTLNTMFSLVSVNK